MKSAMEIQKFLFSLNGTPHIKEIKVTGKSLLNNTNISIPGSKSFTNRAIVLAGMSSDPVLLSGFLFSEDSYWGLDALAKLGFLIEANFDSKKVFISPPRNKDTNFQNQSVFW